MLSPDNETRHWSVTVSRNGEEIVTIEERCLSGRELSLEDEEAIRTAAEHLLAFVGARPDPEMIAEYVAGGGNAR